jgi:hypothetical protein
MGRNTYRNPEMKQPKEKRKIHPIWRGVGFGLMVLTPILAYAGAVIVDEQNTLNGWVRIPRQLISPWVDSHLFVKIILTVFLMILLFVIFNSLTIILNSLFGAKRYGPTDVPSVAYRGRKRP